MQAVYLTILFQLIYVSSSIFVSISLRVACLGCIPPLIGLFFLRSPLRSLYVVAPSLFLLSVILFVFPTFLFLATVSCAGYLLVRCLLYVFSLLISEDITGFDLVWSRLFCDHGWIRSGSVNVR